MKHTVRLGDQETTFEAGALDEAGTCRITAEDVDRQVTLQRVAAHQLRVTAAPVGLTTDDGVELNAPEHTRTLFIARAAEGVWVWSRGRARLVAPANERRGAPGGARGPVTPPMPAVVTEVRVEVGEQVDEGQALVVVSAMKMEMTLSAPYAGSVTAIHTEPGAKVNPGEILVDVAPLEGDGDDVTDH